MFIIIGLLILLVSFVVALFTLIREQKNIESTAQSPKVDVLPLKDPDTLDKAEVTPSDKADRENIMDEVIEKKENVHVVAPQVNASSWENTDDYNKSYVSEEHRIAEIRAELAKIAGEKVSQKGNENFEAANVSEKIIKEPLVATSLGSKLSGEISLRDVKRE